MAIIRRAPWILLAFAAGCACLAAQTQRTLFYGGRVLTMDREYRTAEALIVEEGKIQAVGSTKDLLKAAGPGAARFDLKGRVVVPGFTDSHFHFVTMALESEDIPLTSAKSIAELVALIAAAAQSTPKGEWIIASGNWTLGQLKENRLPTRLEIDQATSDHPVWIPRGDHRGVANSLALKRAGITPATPAPPGGAIDKDRNGELTGRLVDSAQTVMRQAIPKATYAQTAKALAKMQSRLHAVGITTIYDGATTPEDIHAIQQFRDDGQLTLRVAFRPRVKDFAGYQVIGAMPRSGFGDSHLQMGPLKIIVDGGSDGNLFTRPYENRPDYYGVQVTATEEIRKVVLQGNRDGWRFSFHCNGDKAFDILLPILEEANAEKSIVGRRWTIEHGRYPRPDQLPRLKALGLWVSVQANPYWLSSVHIEGFGRERAAYGDPLREFLDAGIPLASGSDHGVYFNPLLHVWWYVTRMTRDSGVLGIEHAITAREALTLATRNPPFLMFEESRKGTIEPGMLADFTVLESDPLNVPPMSIKDIRVLATLVGGRIVFGSL